MLITFRVSDGVFGKGGFTAASEALDWFQKNRLATANLWVDIAVRLDNGNSMVTETFLTKLTRKGE